MIWWLLQGFVTSAALAGVVWALCRWRHVAPAGRHVLWLVLLLKLLMPPVVAWTLPAAPDRTPTVAAGTGGSVSAWERARRWLAAEDHGRTAARNGVAPERSGAADLPTAPAALGATGTSAAGAARLRFSLAAAADAFTLRRLLLAVWLAGGICFAAIQVRRIARMRRWISASAPATGDLSARVAAGARRMGFSPPIVYCIDGLDSPCVFSLFRPYLLWPAGLPSDDASAGLIVHELAHLKRRDHWVGLLELAAGCLWWWSPIYWLARRELRACAELCCDGWVVRMLPAQRHGYAEALIAICERKVTPALPTIALSARSSNRRLKMRLAQIMHGDASTRLSAATIAAAMALFAAAVPACSMAHDLRQDLPFSVSRDTTYLTSPMGPDGTPDYYAALNARYGKDATRDNNGFVVWVEKVNGAPASDDLARRQVPRVFAMCGAIAPPADARRWQSYLVFLREQKKLNPNAAHAEYDPFVSAGQMRLWSAAEHPLLAEYLATVAPQLGAAKAAAEQPHWWIPDVGESMDSALYSLALTSARDVSEGLAARALLRASSGDAQGAVEDIVTMKRLARKFAASSTGIEWLTGAAIERTADQVTAVIAASGKLPAPQCQSFAVALDALPVLADPIHTIDIYERYDLLHLHIMAATDPFEFKRYMDLNVTPLLAVMSADTGTIVEAHPAYSVNPRAADWDRSMRTVNQWIDSEVHMMRTEPRAARHALAVPLDQQRVEWLKEFGNEPTLHPQPGESRDAYSDRLTHSLLASVEPSFEFVPMQYDELRLRGAMARTLVFLAQGKASLSTWKTPLPTDTVGGKPLLPRDVYSAGGRGTEPVRYVLTASGPRLYSVGPNGADDGQEKDDIVVGAPEGAPALFAPGTRP